MWWDEDEWGLPPEVSLAQSQRTCFSQSNELSSILSQSLSFHANPRTAFQPNTSFWFFRSEVGLLAFLISASLCVSRTTIFWGLFVAVDVPLFSRARFVQQIA